MRTTVVESRSLRMFTRAALRGGRPAVDRAWTKLTREGLPLVERIAGDRTNLLVTFVWRPRTRVAAPSVYSPIADSARGETELRPLGTTGVWYRSFRFPRTTRASYGFSPKPSPAMTASDEEWGRYIRSVKPDPMNSNHVPFGEKFFLSVAEVPRARRRSWDKIRGPSRWKEEHHRVPSRNLRGAHLAWVFLPPGYDSRRTQYNLLLGFDGIAYRDAVPTPRIVQNLVEAGRISRTVVVLVGNAPGARVSELNRNPAFARFLARELLPWLRRRYGVRPEAARTVLAGSSLGAVAAAYAALRYPKLFRNVLAQSGAFQWFGARLGAPPTSLMQEYARAPRRPLRFYLEAGTRESTIFEGMPTSLLGSVRHMRDVLEAKGYPVAYREFSGGHDYACWSGTLADGLLHFWGEAHRAAR